MRRISNLFWSFLGLVALLLTSCENPEINYQKAGRVQFADSTAYMPVTEDAERLFPITVGVDHATEYDRHFAVELVMSKSTAIEGYHFDLLSKNVTIKAGELTGELHAQGYFDHIKHGERLIYTLRLLAPKGVVWEMYGGESRISMIRTPRFEIDNFVGNLRLYATFPFSESLTNFLVTSEKLNDSTLLIKQPFGRAYDLRVNFTTNWNEPLTDRVTIPEQGAFVDFTYGVIKARSDENYPSYYVSAGRFFVLWMNLFVEQIGSFGTYEYVFQWVSQAEADAENGQVGTPWSNPNPLFDAKSLLKSISEN